MTCPAAARRAAARALPRAKRGVRPSSTLRPVDICEGILIFVNVKGASYSSSAPPTASLERADAMTLALDPRATALLLIDPQNWTLGMPIQPHSRHELVQ